LYFKITAMEKHHKPLSTDEDSVVEANQEASAKNEAIGEGVIQKYDEINPEHKAFEDIEEVQSTDDV
jgi:hypothetical protein